MDVGGSIREPAKSNAHDDDNEGLCLRDFWESADARAAAATAATATEAA